MDWAAFLTGYGERRDRQTQFLWTTFLSLAAVAGSLSAVVLARLFAKWDPIAVTAVGVGALLYLFLLGPVVRRLVDHVTPTYAHDRRAANVIARRVRAHQGVRLRHGLYHTPEIVAYVIASLAAFLFTGSDSPALTPMALVLSTALLVNASTYVRPLFPAHDDSVANAARLLRAGIDILALGTLAFLITRVEPTAPTDSITTMTIVVAVAVTLAAAKLFGHLFLDNTGKLLEELRLAVLMGRLDESGAAEAYFAVEALRAHDLPLPDTLSELIVNSALDVAETSAAPASKAP